MKTAFSLDPSVHYFQREYGTGHELDLRANINTYRHSRQEYLLKLKEIKQSIGIYSAKMQIS